MKDISPLIFLVLNIDLNWKEGENNPLLSIGVIWYDSMTYPVTEPWGDPIFMWIFFKKNVICNVGSIMLNPAVTSFNLPIFMRWEVNPRL